MIFSHVLYQLSYLGTVGPRMAEPRSYQSAPPATKLERVPTPGRADASGSHQRVDGIGGADVTVHEWAMMMRADRGARFTDMNQRDVPRAGHSDQTVPPTTNAPHESPTSAPAITSRG